MTETIRPLDELREHRDSLCETLAGELDLRSMIWDVHSEIDDELAEVNHGAVEQEIGRIVEALRAIDVDVHELVQLAAVRLPDDSELTPSEIGAVPLPTSPPSWIRRRCSA